MITAPVQAVGQCCVEDGEWRHCGEEVGLVVCGSVCGQVLLTLMNHILLKNTVTSGRLTLVGEYMQFYEVSCKVMVSCFGLGGKRLLVTRVVCNCLFVCRPFMIRITYVANVKVGKRWITLGGQMSFVYCDCPRQR